MIARDRRNLGVCHSDYRGKRGNLQMLLVFLRAVLATRERQRMRDHHLRVRCASAACSYARATESQEKRPQISGSERMVRPPRRILNIK